MSRRNNKNSASRGGNRTPSSSSYSNAANSSAKPKRAPASSSFKGIYQNQSLCHALTALVGTKCEVRVRNPNVTHEGFFNTFSSDMDFAVSAVHKVKMVGDGPTHKGEIIDDMIFPVNEVVSMSFENVDLSFATEDNFTDGAIALKKKDQLSSDKELVSWQPDPDVDDGGDLSDCVIGNPGGPITGNGWSAEDMFNVNKSKFDVKTTYDKDLSGYTVKLERGDVSSEQVKRANQLAKQIEDSANYQQNIKWELEDTRDEETKFSAVDESASAEGDPNRYVPPSLRPKGPPGHSRQNSGPQKATPPPNQRQSGNQQQQQQQSNKTTPRKEQQQQQQNSSNEQRSRKSSENFKEARKSASKEENANSRKQNVASGGSSLGAPPGITAPPQPNRSRNWAGVAGAAQKMAPAGGQNAKILKEDLKIFSNNFNLKQPENAAAAAKSQPQLQSPVQQKDRKNSRATPSPMTKTPVPPTPEAPKSETGTPAAGKPLNPNAKEWTPNVNATEFKPTFGAKKPATPNSQVAMAPMMPQSPPIAPMDLNSAAASQMARPSPHVQPNVHQVSQMPQVYPFQYNQPLVQVPPGHGVVPHIMMQPTGAPIFQPAMAGQPPHIPVSAAQVRGQTPQPGTPQNAPQGQSQPPASKPGGRQRPLRPGHQHPTSPPNMAHVNAGQYVVQPGYPAPHPQHLPQMYQEQQVPGAGYIQVNRNDQYPQYYQQPMHPAVTSSNSQQGGSVVYHHGNPHQPTPHINHSMPHMTHGAPVIQYNHHMSPGNQQNQALGMQHAQMYRQMPPNAQQVAYQPQQVNPQGAPQGAQSQPHQ